MSMKRNKKSSITKTRTKRRTSRFISKPVLSVLLIVIMLLGMVPGAIIAFADDNISVGSGLIEGEAFPVDIDTKDEVLLLEIPDGMYLQGDRELTDEGALLLYGIEELIFTADAGEYTLQLTDADGVKVGDALSFSVALASSDEIKPEPEPKESEEPILGSISGLVWLDKNDNGTKEATETGIANYPVSLYIAGDTSTALMTVNSATDGAYLFDDLEPGTYIVGVKPNALGIDKYLLPMVGIKNDNMFKLATDYINAYSEPIEISGDTEVININAGMRNPMGIVATADGDPIGTLTVSISEKNYQTWKEYSNNTEPSPLTVSIGIPVILSAYAGNCTIELPLDYVPTATTHPDFTYGTDGSNGVTTGTTPAFFELDTDDLDAWLLLDENKIINSYEVADGKLILTLMEKLDDGFAAGTVSVPLRFNFNSDWYGMVPGGTKIFTVAPVAKNGSNIIIDATPSSQEVLGRVSDSPLELNNLTFSRPQNTANLSSVPHFGGAVILSFRLHNYYYYRNVFDPSFENIIWIEIPTGSTPASRITDYFTGLTIVGTGSNGVPIGYTRYQRILDTDLDVTATSHPDYNNWHYQNAVERAFNTTVFDFTPPDSLMIDEREFEVRYGITYRNANGTIQTLQEGPITYIKDSRPIWAIYLSSTHSTGDNNARQAVCGIHDGAVAQNYLTAGFPGYDNASCSKNIGTGPIKGVTITLYQYTTESP
ncbi:MAG: hypothetical protein FWG21_04545, partial [Oscillospiraceae bacterium]|nr:hypothetical protein [Oscillospiraceae bacterium]